VFAAEHPGRVQAFLAVDTSPFSGAYYSALDRWLLSVTPALLKLYPYNYLVRTIARSIAVDEAAQASALSALQMLTKSEIADIMQAVYTGLLQYAERDLQMSVPTLIVYGEKDRSGKVISYSKRWAAEEGHELDVIPNAAHNSNADNPDYFNRIATDFFTRHM
jgi:pimeloyl-ACP methyl ester carboxylesterase